MTNGDAMRASDEDRERVVRILQEQVGEGRLTLDEFEQRSQDVYTAKTIGDLRGVVRDLPVDPFPKPRAEMPSWQMPLPMSPIPPWRQSGGRQVAMRRSPLVAVLAVIGTLMVLGLVASVVMQFVFPVVIIGLVLMGLSTRGRGRRYPPRR